MEPVSVPPFDVLCRNTYRGVKAEGVVGAGNVVVDRFGNTDDIDAHVEKFSSRTQGVISPYCYDGAQFILPDVIPDLL